MIKITNITTLLSNYHKILVLLPHILSTKYPFNILTKIVFKMPLNTLKFRETFRETIHHF